MSDEEERRSAILNERRLQLFVRVGAITVAGGHAEYALQRLAHVLSGGSRWNNLDTTVPVERDRLDNELRKYVAAKPENETMQRLGELLDWAEAERLWTSRNNVIHADWREPPAGPFLAYRYFRDRDPATIIYAHEDLDRVASNLDTLTQRLCAVLDELTPGPQPSAQWVWPEGL